MFSGLRLRLVQQAALKTDITNVLRVPGLPRRIDSPMAALQTLARIGRLEGKIQPSVQNTYVRLPLADFVDHVSLIS